MLKFLIFKRAAQLRVFCYALATLAVLTCNPLDSQAQCTPDCFDSTSNWGAAITDTLSLSAPCDSCEVIVTYVTRLACGVHQDIQITQIEIIGNSCNCTPKQIFEAAFRALLTRVPPIFPNPLPGQCASTWRISAVSCFNYWEVQLYPEGDTLVFLTPCDTEACCLTPLRICRDSTGVVDSIEILGGPFGTGDCSTAEPINGDSTCFTTCEFDDLELGKGSARPNFGRVNDINSADRVLVIPNPVTGSVVTFDLKMASQGKAQLRVYNILGQVVQETTVELEGTHTRVTLDVGNLHAGSYIYELSVEGRKLVSDKLIISR